MLPFDSHMTAVRQPDPFPVAMMPGQAPYTEAELEQLYELVADAAAGDPGEAGEIEAHEPR